MGQLKRISLDDYVPRWESIHFQYLFINWAIDHLKRDPKAQEDYVRLAEEGKKDLKKYRAEGGAASNEIEGSVRDILSRAAFSLIAAENANRQNLIILQIAQFESFYKDIHRQILKFNLNLLREDRQIPLGKIINRGHQEILEEEVSREVDILDRKSLENKIKYFINRLGVSKEHLDGPFTRHLDEAISLRNRILHESCEMEITEKQVNEAEISCLIIGIFLFQNSWQKYPEIFLFGKY